ncbi:hypothetical protein ScPMuIL_008145 [Solemya velum]
MRRKMASRPTYLLNAVSEGSGEDIRRVIDSGIFDINETDRLGRSCLHIASMRGNLDLVELLLKHGADINAKDHHWNTALHVCGHVDTISVLVQYGAKLESRNKIHATPKDMAIKRGVNQSVIHFYQSLENKTTLHIAEGQTTSSFPSQTIERTRSKPVPSIWYEFSEEMGVKRLLFLVLAALSISLYAAYILTSASKQVEMTIPVDGGQHHIEL